tara:strand:- start:1432 stop:1860 length:429 start_codon:yes stop_codon:yes gene_type:complete
MKLIPSEVVEIIVDFSIEPITDSNIKKLVDDYFKCIRLSTIYSQHYHYIRYEYLRKAVISKYGDISEWDVSRVTNMSRLFKNISRFNSPIGGWNTSNVTDMSCMFENAECFDQYIGGWDTSNVTDMSYMFSGAGRFDSILYL